MRKARAHSVVVPVLLALCACKPASVPAGKEEAIAAADGPSAGPALPDIGAPLADAAASPFQGEFEAVGEEPYWTLDVLKDWVSFARLNLPGVGALPGTRRYGAQGMTLDAGPLSLALTPGPCMTSAGNAHEFNAAVRHDGVLYQGCARRLTGERVSAGWASNLQELMPAITLCLGRVKAGPAQITIAYQDSEGEISVRLLESDGGRYECITRQDASAIRYFDVIGDQDTLDGERDPLFTPAPGLPKTGPCFATEPAPDGLGTLTRRVC